MDDDNLFLAVVDGGSFRAAALATGLDPSRVSRRVAALEDRLGVKLLNRTTRASSLTEVGAQYAEGIRRLTESRATLLEQVTGGQTVPTGRLRIAAPTDFGARFIAPVLSKLSADYPGLTVDLRLGSAFTDLLAEGIDVAIRIGQLADSALTARKIGLSRRVLVGTSELAKNISTPEDLAHTETVSYRHGLSEVRLKFEFESKSHEVRIPCRFGVNSMMSIRDAVLQGRVVHLGPEWAYQDDITEGRLVRILPKANFAPFPIHAVWSPTPFQTAAARVFITATMEKLRTERLS